jgi:tRNA(fMet)-specific endonuclease VapC
MLFDTTFLIDYEREIKRNTPGPAHRFLSQHPNVPLYVSIISVAELAEGFALAQQQDCWLCLRHYTFLYFNRDIAWQTGQISRALRAAGQMIGDNDLVIAATAQHHQLQLVTKNASHFRRVTGLELVTY